MNATLLLLRDLIRHERIMRALLVGVAVALPLSAKESRDAVGVDSRPPVATTEHWAFRKPSRPVVPSITWHAGRIHNEIDAFILAKLHDEQLEPGATADRRTLARRAFFDLIGLPPPPERVEAFVNDASADAWPRLIDELLASPQYGERWARHWLDVARYADTGGYETDMYYRNAWRYRDYVVKSFNDDKPYDRFVQEQIAGDELWPDDLELDGSYEMAPKKIAHLEARIGTGFYALEPQVHESNMDAGKRRYEQLTDWTDATGSAFLGLTLGCARCHDHKFDPISQRDYFAMQAVFAGTRQIDEPVVNAMEIADFQQHYPRIIAVDEARRRYRQFVQALKDRQPTPAEEERKQELLRAIAQAVLDLPERAASTPGTSFDGLMEVPTATVLGHDDPALIRPVHRLSRGDLGAPLEQVQPAFPAVLARTTNIQAEFSGPLGSRKELALWLTRPDHPLLARVMVNRLWQWHFGRGIVATPNDFGKMGQPPSHAELLDWLATEFIARGWSVKQMHRLIMLSSTYQQSSSYFSEEHGRRDPQNSLLWRMNRRRLEGEALWDALHVVSGTINLTMGGRPVMPPLTQDEQTNKAQWVTSADPKDHARRGIYIIVRRNFRFPLFEVFDSPVNAVSCAGRAESTVAPQALWLMNNRTALVQAQQFAARLVQETGKEPTAWVDRAWRLALSRRPTSDELTEALALLGQISKPNSSAAKLEEQPAALTELSPEQAAALVKLCLSLLNVSEFIYVD